MNFKIGQLISAYDTEGHACKGRIASFDGSFPETGPLARIRLLYKDDVYVQIKLNTAHHLPVNKATHSKETFLAAASRCSPAKYFKDEVSRRDYLEGLWEELANFSQDND